MKKQYVIKTYDSRGDFYGYLCPHQEEPELLCFTQDIAEATIYETMEVAQAKADSIVYDTDFQCVVVEL